MPMINLEARGGAPAEVFWFRAGSTNYGLYTSQDVARSVAFPSTISLTGGVVVLEFNTLPITREAIDGDSQNLRIRLPADSAVGALFVGQRPIFTLSVAIYRVHRGDATPWRWFYGDVVGAAVEGSIVVLNCAPKTAAIKRPFLRILYQAPCNNLLYDAFCGVNPSAFDTAGSIDAIAADGVTLTISEADALDDGWFTAGLLQFGNEYGFIVDHVGETITLLRPVPGLAVSSSVTLFAGCDRSLETCTNKFSNTANHMGFPFIPSIDVFAKGVTD